MELTFRDFIKRELLGFCTVEELPKDSNRTLASMMSCATRCDFEPQKNLSRSLHVSVLPAPDWPAMIIDCGLSSKNMFLLTSLAVGD